MQDNKLKNFWSRLTPEQHQRYWRSGREALAYYGFGDTDTSANEGLKRLWSYTYQQFNQKHRWNQYPAAAAEVMLRLDEAKPEEVEKWLESSDNLQYKTQGYYYMALAEAEPGSSTPNEESNKGIVWLERSLGLLKGLQGEGLYRLLRLMLQRPAAFGLEPAGLLEIEVGLKRLKPADVEKDSEGLGELRRWLITILIERGLNDDAQRVALEGKQHNSEFLALFPVQLRKLLVSLDKSEDNAFAELGSLHENLIEELNRLSEDTDIDNNRELTPLQKAEKNHALLLLIRAWLSLDQLDKACRLYNELEPPFAREVAQIEAALDIAERRSDFWPTAQKLLENLLREIQDIQYKVDMLARGGEVASKLFGAEKGRHYWQLAVYEIGKLPNLPQRCLFYNSLAASAYASGSPDIAECYWQAAVGQIADTELLSDTAICQLVMTVVQFEFEKARKYWIDFKRRLQATKVQPLATKCRRYLAEGRALAKNTTPKEVYDAVSQIGIVSEERSVLVHYAERLAEQGQLANLEKLIELVKEADVELDYYNVLKKILNGQNLEQTELTVTKIGESPIAEQVAAYLKLAETTPAQAEELSKAAQGVAVSLEEIEQRLDSYCRLARYYFDKNKPDKAFPYWEAALSLMKNQLWRKGKWLSQLTTVIMLDWDCYESYKSDLEELKNGLSQDEINQYWWYLLPVLAARPSEDYVWNDELSKINNPLVRIEALTDVAEALFNRALTDELLKLAQVWWAQAATREECLGYFEMVRYLVGMRPELYDVLSNSIKP